MSHNNNAQHGRDKEFEHDDPMELQAVVLAGGDEEMQAKTFIEEFLFMGTSKEELINIFKNPFYAGAYHLYNQLGDEKIDTMINEYFKTTNKQI